jgi:hypothetical protein
MEAAMVEWIVLGIILVMILIVKLLDYLDLFDIVEFFGAVAKLVTSVIALLAAFLLWSARKLAGTKATPKPAPDETSPAPRGKIQSRTIARNGRR